MKEVEMEDEETVHMFGKWRTEAKTIAQQKERETLRTELVLALIEAGVYGHEVILQAQKAEDFILGKTDKE